MSTIKQHVAYGAQEIEMVLFPGSCNGWEHAAGQKVFSAHLNFMWPSGNIYMPISHHRDTQSD